MGGLLAGLKLRKAHRSKAETNGNGHDYRGDWVNSVEERLSELASLSSKAERLSVEFGYVRRDTDKILVELDKVAKNVNGLRIALGVQERN